MVTLAFTEAENIIGGYSYCGKVRLYWVNSQRGVRVFFKGDTLEKGNIRLAQSLERQRKTYVVSFIGILLRCVVGRSTNYSQRFSLTCLSYSKAICT